MKKNIKLMIITLLICFFTYTPNVFADIKVKGREDITIDGKYVYKNYQNLAVDTNTITSGNAGILTVNIDGTDYTAFCVDFGVSIKFGTSEDPINLYTYFRNVLEETKTKELIQKITLYTKFGYGETNNTDKHYMATQTLIWQAISDSGFYNSDFYKQRSGKKIIISNLKWVFSNGQEVDLSKEIQTIESAIKNYKQSYYKTPSFCSSNNKIELQAGESATYQDSNGVLSEYQVLCSEGITCQKDGNNLTVTSSDKAGNHQISFIKPELGKEQSVYRVGTSQGMILIADGVSEGISCDFGINTFKNEKTSDTQIMYITMAGLFCGIMAYISYYTKKSLDQFN